MSGKLDHRLSGAIREADESDLFYDSNSLCTVYEESERPDPSDVRPTLSRQGRRRHICRPAAFVYQRLDFERVSSEVPQIVHLNVAKQFRLLQDTFILHVNYLRRRQQVQSTDASNRRGARKVETPMPALAPPTLTSRTESSLSATA